MSELIRWDDVEQRLDQIERFDWAAIIEVFLEFEGRQLDPRDTNGRKKTVTIGSFCSYFNLSRHLFVNWLHETLDKATA